MSEVYFPPGVECFHPDGSGAWNSEAYAAGNCGVTEDMLAFLNLTSSITDYIAAYCLNPAPDDSCPFGFCPHPNIAGPLVRIAAYVTTLCTSILVFYSPKRVKAIFWSQILTIYSLLLTACLSIYRRELTRYHALLVSVIVASPLTIYLVVYSVRAVWGGQHRLENVLGRGRVFERLFVLFAAVIWAGLTAYSLIPQKISHFAQPSCKRQPLMSNFFMITPISVGITEWKEKPWLRPVVSAPFLLIVLAWVIAILLKRRVIWPRSEPYRVNFWKVVTVVGEYFPFIHFVSIVVIPFTYWVTCIELAVYKSNENKLTLTFSQVLAAFAAIPPYVQVCKLAPRLFRWFYDPAWLRRTDGDRPELRNPSMDEGTTTLLGKHTP